jgi:hypothetical protein
VVDPAELDLPDLGVILIEDAETGEQLLVDTSDPILRSRLAGQVGARRALVHPFAHLFGEPAPLPAAVELLDGLTDALRAHGLEASRSPFGWFFSWELSARGHPLSRLARRFTLD